MRESWIVKTTDVETGSTSETDLKFPSRDLANTCRDSYNEAARGYESPRRAWVAGGAS